MKKTIITCTLALAAFIIPATGVTPTMKREPFAKTEDGETVERFTLTNKNGVSASLITWGASLTEMHVPDKDKKFADVTLGFDKPEPWLKPHPFFGTSRGGTQTASQAENSPWMA